MNKRKNLITAVIFQIVTIAYGLIIPRLILNAFGSSINGLISSITQFLSFISLLEGGLGAVILAELYYPIEKNDSQLVKSILNASKKLFLIIGIIYIAFTLIVAVGFSLYMGGEFDFAFTSTLVLILSLATISQYLFSITNRLLLQAEQRIFIVNITSTCTLLFNFVVAIVVIYVFPNVHLLKLGTSIAFFIQPIIYGRLVDIKYKKIEPSDKNYKIKNRWSGFAQNLAHFVNMNTDVIVITIIMGLTDVSIYTVYMLAINALRALVATINNSYQSAFGKHYLEGVDSIRRSFDRFSLLNHSITLILFMTCLILINPFVGIYTNKVTDANYYQPFFALIMVIANCVYCIREPYRLLVLSAGKFKETNLGSYLEAAINLGVTIVLTIFFGLIGAAVGTLVAISFRLLYFMWFLKRNILFYGYKKYLFDSLKIAIVFCANIAFYFVFPFQIQNFMWFILYGVICFVVESIIVILVYVGPKKFVNYAVSIFRRSNS